MNENNFDIVIARSKAALGVEKDSELASELGMHNSTWGNRKSRKSLPYDELIKTLQLNNISLDSIFSDLPAALVSEEAGEYNIVRRQSRDGYSQIPISYDVQASAGQGLQVIDSNWSILDVPDEWFWLNTHTKPKATHRIIGVNGDSMTEVFSPGDLILIDTAYNYIDSSGIYIFKQNAKLLVKKLNVRLDGVVEVISKNPEWHTYQLDPNTMQAEIVAKVVCKWNYQP